MVMCSSISQYNSTSLSVAYSIMEFSYPKMGGASAGQADANHEGLSAREHVIHAL